MAVQHQQSELLVLKYMNYYERLECKKDQRRALVYPGPRYPHKKHTEGGTLLHVV